MAKKGMRRPGGPGKAKTGNAKAGPINAPNWARDDYKTGDKFQ